MPNAVYLGFDFGFKRIGIAVGQTLTKTASPVTTLKVSYGIPEWPDIKKIIQQWNPKGLIVGLPTCTDNSELYTTQAAKDFAEKLHEHFSLPTHLVDERFSTVEARELLFRKGGYRKIQNTDVDSIAACIILEHWLHHQKENL